jgi:hypothetical protein
MLISSPAELYPYKLFNMCVLENDESRVAFAAELRTDSKSGCLLDEFSKRFIADFPGEKLHSRECQAALIAIAYLTKLDISRIECRHASIRKLLVNHVSWTSEFSSISSDWILDRCQTMRQGSLESLEEGHHKEDDQGPQRGQKRKRCPGGAMRAFFLSA